MPERAGDLPAVEISGSELLALSRRDREAARARLRALSDAGQVERLLELRHAARHEMLMLCDHPENLVPLLPEQEFVATLVAGGMSEAPWLLELARPEQRVACIDLDAWTTYRLSFPRMRSWIDALVEAGPETLARALGEIDPEVWVLSLREMGDAFVIGKEEEAPDGAFTEDGVCHFRPRSEEDHARLRAIFRTAFSLRQPIYWQFVYGMLFELVSESEEYALRWRTARLGDLGFPDREQAMEAYRPLAFEDAPVWEEGGEAAGDLVPAYQLPRQLEGTLVGRALAELPPDRAADVLGYLLAVANAIAVADHMSLSDPDSIPDATAKAIRGIDLGLGALARARRQDPAQVLDRTRPIDLFRIGASSEPTLAPVPLPDEELSWQDGEDGEEEESPV